MTKDSVSREWSRGERRLCCVSVPSECTWVRVACEGMEEVGLCASVRPSVSTYGKEYVGLLTTKTFEFAYLRCVPTGLGLFGALSSSAVCRFPDAVQVIVRGDGPRCH